MYEIKVTLIVCWFLNVFDTSLYVKPKNVIIALCVDYICPLLYINCYSQLYLVGLLVYFLITEPAGPSQVSRFEFNLSSQWMTENVEKGFTVTLIFQSANNLHYLASLLLAITLRYFQNTGMLEKPQEEGHSNNPVTVMCV